MRDFSLLEGEGTTRGADIRINRDEIWQVSVPGREVDRLILTISDTPGGDPLLELHGVGEVRIYPAAIESLTEGAAYPYNIWVPLDVDAGDYELIFAGRLLIGNSIAPTGAASPGGPEPLVAIVVSRAEYEALQEADKAAVVHAAAKNNPHGVTAAQVGLGSVNNTADADKPVSTAQQAVLDAFGSDLDWAMVAAGRGNERAVTKGFTNVIIGEREIFPTVVSYDAKVIYGIDIATGLPWSGEEINRGFSNTYPPITYVGGRAKLVTEYSYDSKPLKGWSLDTGLQWSSDDPFDHKNISLEEGVVDGRAVLVKQWSYDGYPVKYYFLDTGLPPDPRVDFPEYSIPRAFEITSRLRAVGGPGQSNTLGSSYEASSNVYPHTRGDLVVLGGEGRDDIWLQRARIDGSIRVDFDGLDRFVPLRSRVSGGLKGTTAVEGACHTLLNAGSPPILTFNDAEGGESIENLLPNPPEEGKFAWANAVATMERMQQVKRADQYIEYDWLLMMQGESNTSTENLGELHNLYRANVETEAKRIFGQKSAVKMLTRQPSSFGNPTGVLSILDEALAQKDSGTFFLSGPTYHYAYSEDFLHHTSEAHVDRGVEDALIVMQIEKRGKYLPLHVTYAGVTGPNEITITFNMPVVLNDDYSGVAAVENSGIEVVGTDVASIGISGGGQVGQEAIIQTTGDASLATSLRFGLRGQSSPRTAAKIPRTNIRADEFMGMYPSGKPVKQWLCHQEVAL